MSRKRSSKASAAKPDSNAPSRSKANPGSKARPPLAPRMTPSYLVVDATLPSHIFSDRSLFTTYIPARKVHRTAFGNDITIEGTGDVHIRVVVGGQGILFRMRDCWHVPSSPHHFLSCPTVTLSGFQVMIAGRTPRMLFPHKRRVAEPNLPKYVPFKREDGYFVLKFEIPMKVSAYPQPATAAQPVFSLHASSTEPFAGFSFIPHSVTPSPTPISTSLRLSPSLIPSTFLHHSLLHSPIQPSSSPLPIALSEHPPEQDLAPSPLSPSLVYSPPIPCSQSISSFNPPFNHSSSIQKPWTLASQCLYSSAHFPQLLNPSISSLLPSVPLIQEPSTPPPISDSESILSSASLISPITSFNGPSHLVFPSTLTPSPFILTPHYIPPPQLPPQSMLFSTEPSASAALGASDLPPQSMSFSIEPSLLPQELPSQSISFSESIVQSPPASLDKPFIAHELPAILHNVLDSNLATSPSVTVPLPLPPLSASSLFSPTFSALQSSTLPLNHLTRLIILFNNFVVFDHPP